MADPEAMILNWIQIELIFNLVSLLWLEGFFFSSSKISF